MKKLLVCFAFLALAVASAKSYAVNFSQKVFVGATELRPGEYKLEVVGDKAILRAGSNTVEAPVKVEMADETYQSTSFRMDQGDGKSRVTEIRLGGTKTKLVFN